MRAASSGPMPTVSATAPATATRRPPSPILTHRLRWRIAAHLVGDEVFTFGRPRCLYCKRGQLQGRKVRPPPASSLLGLPEPPLLSSPPSRLRRSSYPRYQSSLRSSDAAGPAVPGRPSTNGQWVTGWQGLGARAGSKLLAQAPQSQRHGAFAQESRARLSSWRRYPRRYRRVRRSSGLLGAAGAGL